ncbi:10863_t:CDS:2, partial [Acaulospora morrowiae]
THYRRNLYKNRLEVYELVTPEDPIPSFLTIRNAIELSATAWNSVTEATIKSSWFRTGILPSEASDDYKFTDGEIEDKLADLIYQMPQISNSLTAIEYIQIDDQALSGEQITDKEIIQFVNGEEAQEPENNEELELPVKVSDALEGLTKVIKYLQQNDL